VNNYCDRIGFWAGLTAILLVASPSLAAQQKITEVKINESQNDLELKLKNDVSPSFFTVREGNIIKANLLHTDLDLPQGKSFRQENPLPGIKTVEINRLDQEHTQIIIATEEDISLENLIQQQGKDLILSFDRLQTSDSLSEKFNLAQAITNIKNTYQSVVTGKQTKDDTKDSKIKKEREFNQPDVLIPNPEVTITNGKGEIVDDWQAASPSNSTLPRAVAPPVGDMAVSNINAAPDLIDLGSRALVPRMVLRDAPIREVLSLLARSAGLNVVFASGKAGTAEKPEDGPTISLDLENQPVQEVFNSVLLVSGLNANRQGNILYIGEKLPAQARNLVSRTIRLNQVKAEDAALYLASQGAKGKRLTTEIEETIDPETGRVVKRVETDPELSDLDGGAEEDGTSALLLQGLQVATDARLNSLTLVGEPRKVEVAAAMLTQLDARRRQVAVNVKVIDVNLLNQDIFNSSFSFKVNNTYLLQDQGSAALNFGGNNPTINESFVRRPRGDEATIFEKLPEGNLREIRIPTPSELPDKFLALLESKIVSGNAKVLTDPTLTVQEGQQATVELTQKIVESVKTEIDGDSGARTITPEIGKAGLILTVDVERIDDNGFVSLSVSPSVSSVGATQSFNSAGAINTLNLLSERKINSGLVRLRDSQTLILSGIIQDQERINVSKIPILGDIPLLGSLFRSTDKTNERAEVIVLLTPQIVDEQSSFGYNYTPSQESREVLKKEGVGLPGNP
jgi:type IV pilus assembly protein PilQ